MVPWHYFQYASGSGVGSTGEKKKQNKGEHPMSVEKTKHSSPVCRGVLEPREHAAADELMTAEATIFLPGRGQVNKESFKAFALSLR